MSIKSLTAKKSASGLTSLFNDFFEPWTDWTTDGAFGRSLTMPSVNITEDKNNYNLSVAAPGMQKKDFKIEIDGNVLTVSAEKEENKEEKDEKYTRQEYNYSSFARSFTLPDEVEQEKIGATYEGGILKLELPKNEKAAKKLHKNVSIK